MGSVELKLPVHYVLVYVHVYESVHERVHGKECMYKQRYRHVNMNRCL